MLMLGWRNNREGPGEPAEGQMQDLLGDTAEKDQ
jgi:hypothetical protein